ncbi:uncharacterized protein LOC144101341 isoform X1 [Amblyomma americanum]
MLTYGCLRTLTSTAKRWLPILGLVVLIYIGFWTAGYNPVGWPVPRQQALGAVTITHAEPSYRYPHKSQASIRQGLQLNDSTTSDASWTPPTSEEVSSTARQGPREVTLRKQTSPLLLTEPETPLSRPTTSMTTRATTRRTRGTTVTTPATTTAEDNGLTWNPPEQLLRGYGKVPFPVENVTSLPTAFKVVSDCQRDLDYIFFVHTATTHSDHRRVLREVVANSSFGAQYNWTTVFFVGMSPVDQVWASVTKEAELHGDVVVLPYMDTYRNLTYKFVYGIKWTLENCPRARFVLKMDDDIVLHLPTLVKKFTGSSTGASSSSTPLPPKFHCCVWDGMPVIRQTALPWYMSNEVYPKKYFPRYCSGSAVFMESAALRPLYNASFEVPYLPVDDAYVTGELAAVAGIGHEALNRIYSFDGSKWMSVVDGTLLVVQVWSAETRSKAWRLVANALGEQWATVMPVPSSRVTHSARSVVFVTTSATSAMTAINTTSRTS